MADNDQLDLHFTIVDDEKPLLFLITWTLSQSFPQCTMTTFDDGVLALQYLRQQPTDFLITDHRMLHMNGDELVRELREIGITVPILMVSSSPFAKQAAANENITFLEKKDITTELIRTVRSLLHEHKSIRKIRMA